MLSTLLVESLKKCKSNRGRTADHWKRKINYCDALQQANHGIINHLSIFCKCISFRAQNVSIFILFLKLLLVIVWLRKAAFNDTTIIEYISWVGAWG